jgi:hypothetical protein
MRPRICLLLLAVIAGTVFSQTTVNLCGLVRDQGGNPLTNTLVRLSVTKLVDGVGTDPYYTTTDSTGYYHLGSGTCQTNVIQESSRPLGNVFSHPILVGRELAFSVPQDNARVRISLFDMTGRLIKDLVNARKANGSYSVTIDTRDVSSQFYVVRVSINGVSTVFKLQPLSRGAAVAAQNAPEFHASVKKLAAIVDTIHATEPGYSLGVTPIDVTTGQYDFVLTKNNTWGGDTAGFWGDTAATSAAAKAAGHFIFKLINKTPYPDSLIYWADGDGGVPVKMSDNSMPAPGGNAGRLYIMVGYNAKASVPYRPMDKTHVWDFEEHNYGASNYDGNLTRVDWFGTPLAMRLHCTDGTPDLVRGEIYPLFFQTRQSIFDEFINEVPAEWDICATITMPAKITNPCMTPDFSTGGSQAHYWDAYSAKCGVTAGACVDNGSPAISSGLYRHVLDLTDAQQKDWNYHYKKAPCTFYGYFIHRRSFYHLQYTFPYDDYNNFSSYIAKGNAQWLEIAVGY